MRFLQIASFYPAYLGAFYGRAPDLAAKPFADQIGALLEDGFGGGHLIAPYMKAAGFESDLIITNAVEAQTQWALANGMAAPRSNDDLRALVARQIAAMAPDVLYVLDPIAFDGRFIAALDHKPRLVIGWRAANIPAGTAWDGFDVMLSSDAGCRARALELGAQAAAAFRPGFPRHLADRLANTPKTADVVFCGQITVEHGHRLQTLEELVAGLAKTGAVSAALHLGLPKDSAVAATLKPYDCGSVWGLDMYRAVKGGKVAPNFHIDLAASKNQNMRILETTGVGTFLLTEFDDRLADTFAPGREVETYRSTGELIEKTRHYASRDTEREDIARRGQARCFADHGMDVRAKTLGDLIAHYMPPAKPRSKPKVSTAPVAPMVNSPDINAALAHLRAGWVNEAADLLNRLIQKDGSNAVVILLLGRVAFLVGEVTTATELFQTAGALKLTDDWAWIVQLDLAAAAIKLDKANDALLALRRAYALAPHIAEIPARLLALLDRMNARDEATMFRDRLGDDVALPGVVLESLYMIGDGNGPERMDQSDTNLKQLYPGVVFGDGVQCVGTGSLKIGAGSVVGDGSWLNVCIRDNQPRMVIGESVLVGRRAVLSSGTYLEIGAYTIFGPNVYVSSAEHEYVGNHLKPILNCGVRDLGRLVVEENCWLGMNAVVDGNLTVGRGSVVGANSVLRRSIPPFSIAVGAPARVVRMLNPVTEQWELIESDADTKRIEEARARKPFPDRAVYKALLDKNGGRQALHPVVAGLGLHLP
ncbi:MAG: glycosyltransferase [Alphaproteobacteria bacterium]|nr:glycosyltransferase [Alphaproteobacteria bacterium]